MKKDVFTNSNNISEKYYSIKEVSEKTGISIHTLRYYDKECLFPLLKRDKNNVRIFTDNDIDWIHLIECLRKTNFSIKEIRHYVELNLQGDSTVEERYGIICNQEAVLKQQLDELKNSMQKINMKKKFYEDKLKSLADNHAGSDRGYPCSSNKNSC